MKLAKKSTRMGGEPEVKVPPDLRRALAALPKIEALWKDLTPLARNEWICWVTSGKKAETRNIRIEKALSKLKGGMRRPCCWAGCIHRCNSRRRRKLPLQNAGRK